MPNQLLIILVVATISPSIHCTALHGASKEGSSNAKAVGDADFQLKHPEYVHWIERAVDRMKNHKNASVADITEVKENLIGLREHLYEFVTSPIFFFSTDMLIERAVNLAIPFLGVLPLKELRELSRIVQKDPSLSELLLDETKHISDKIPGGNELDQWFANSTAHVVTKTMESMTSANATNVTMS